MTGQESSARAKIEVFLLRSRNPKSASCIQSISERMGNVKQAAGELLRLVKRMFITRKQKRVSSKSIHVCYVSFFPPSRGRLSEYAFFLVDALKRLPSIGRIDVVCDNNRPSTISISDKVTLHGVWESDNIFSILSIPFRILKLRPDIVHFNLHMAVFGRTRIANFVGLSIPFLCRLMGIPCIATLHNIVERIDVEKTGMKNTFLNRLGAFLVTKLLTLNSLLTVTVRSYVGFLHRRYKCSNIKWVPHGTWKVNLFNQIGGGNSYNILYFGHHGPYKDPKLLFDAIQILSRKLKIQLIVGGHSHPNYPNFLEEHKNNNNLSNVHFTGFVPNSLLHDLFQKVDLLVLPYHTCTGTSGVAHLAASHGVPIVATDLPELRELANEGCGIVFCSHNPVSLAKKIEYVLGNPEVAFDLRERSLRFAHGRTWDKIARAFEKCYGEVLKKDTHALEDNYCPKIVPERGRLPARLFDDFSEIETE